VEGGLSQAHVLGADRIEQELQQLGPLVVPVIAWEGEGEASGHTHTHTRCFAATSHGGVGLRTRERSPFLTDEVARQLGGDVAHLLADVGRGLLLDAGEQLRLHRRLHVHRQPRVDLLEGGGQQPPQQHRRHLLDLRRRGGGGGGGGGAGDKEEAVV